MSAATGPYVALAAFAMTPSRSAPATVCCGIGPAQRRRVEDQVGTGEIDRQARFVMSEAAQIPSHAMVEQQESEEQHRQADRGTGRRQRNQRSDA